MGGSNGPDEYTGQSTSADNNVDAGDFECNICFDLAQDPIITLCGHLFCWPCLYRWLNHHSISHECPVCKAIIEEEKLVPLYGRGKLRADPRAKSYPGIHPPRRPSIQRPETAASAFPSYGTAARPGNGSGSGNVTFSAVLGTGLSFLPSLFNFHFQNYSDATVYGSTSGYPYGFHAFHGGYAHRFPMNSTRGQQGDAFLRNLLIVLGLVVLLFLMLCW